MRGILRRVAVFGGAVVVAAGITVLPATAASAAPVFKLPFECGQSWYGQTRTDHNPSKAVDFNRAGDLGRRVLASAPGRVSTVRNLGNDSYGKYVVINHGGGWTTYYAHLRSFKVRKGAKVSYGTVIGRVGSTGGSSGPHLHYEQRHNGSSAKVRFNGRTAKYWGTRTYKSDNCKKPDPVRADVAVHVPGEKVLVDPAGRTVAVKVGNHGPDTARKVRLTIDLKNVGKQLKVSGVSGKACRTKRSTITCSYDRLRKGATRAVSLKLRLAGDAKRDGKVKPGSAGTLAVTVGSRTADVRKQNNTDTAKLAVVDKAPTAYDLGVTAGKAKGARGETVPVKLTVTNRGPADARGVATIVAPTGTELVGVPAGCAISDNRRRANCESKALALAAGEAVTSKLRLKIVGERVAGDGFVKVRGTGAGSDRTEKNNRAALKVELAGNAGGGGGGGGGLPVTGTPIWLAAAIGLGLLLLGGVVLLLSRARPGARSR